MKEEPYFIEVNQRLKNSFWSQFIESLENYRNAGYFAIKRVNYKENTFYCIVKFVN